MATDISITRMELAEVILASLSKGEEKKVAKQVAEYLLKAGKTADLSSLMRDVAALRAEKEDIVEVTALSAHPLDTTDKTEVNKVAKSVYPNAKQVILNEQLDPGVVGGIRLSFPNQQLDVTIKSKLTRLRGLIDDK